MTTIADLVALWFGLRRRVTPLAYVASGFGLMLFKYAVDVAVTAAATGRFWHPASYLSPLLSTKVHANEPDWLLLWMALWALPFIWIGVSMTVRRAVDAGLSPWTGLLFFVPIVNYLGFVVLCVLPSHPPPPDRRPTAPLVPARTRETLTAALAGATIGIAAAVLSIYGLGGYGASLFLGTPFTMGVVSAYAFNRRARRTSVLTNAVVQLSVGLVGGGMLLFALEGIFCLVMAYPVAAPVAFLGGLLGRELAGRRPIAAAPAALLLALPALIAAEGTRPPPAVREVATSVVIDAPPARVWPHVVGFSELPPPTRLVFDLGIAYPVRARIDGTGVGAVRRCEFSTGAFVEPITVWEPPQRLGFDVAEQPEPMQEWSPYARVHAPHLLDGLRSRRGEFRLVALADGRTRLEGSTWYTLDMAPALYWTRWSDALIHTIHRRVLEHVRTLAEEATSPLAFRLGQREE